jgi:hypothetical protein
MITPPWESCLWVHDLAKLLRKLLASLNNLQLRFGSQVRLDLPLVRISG